MAKKRFATKSGATKSHASASHTVLPGSKRGKDPDATVIGKVDPKEKVTVTIGLKGPKLPSADEYVGQTLTPEEFSQKFAASKADADTVTKALKKFGLKVEEVSLENRSMRVSGTAAAMESALAKREMCSPSGRIVLQSQGSLCLLRLPARAACSAGKPWSLA